MATEVKVKNGTPIVWADTTDYSSATSGYSRTHQIDLTSLASASARQGDKADLGATRARCYAVYVGGEFDTAPTAGATVEVWWSESASATAGVGNSGGASGADGAYHAGEETEWKKQLTRIGSLVCTADAEPTVQRQFVGFLWPKKRYGMPVIVNGSGTDFDTDAVEAYVALVPVVDEVQ